MLNVLFNNEGFELYAVEYKEKVYMFVRKLRTLELRLLFFRFPDGLIDELKQEFKPPYIAYNELLENPKDEYQIEDIELTVHTEEYLALKNKTIRKHYRQAIKQNMKLVVRPFTDIPFSDLETFWQQWSKQLTEKKELFTDRTKNDKRFFTVYDEREYFGVVVYDKNVLVGYSVGIKTFEIFVTVPFSVLGRGLAFISPVVNGETSLEGLASEC
jgi:hypothetical protein